MSLRTNQNRVLILSLLLLSAIGLSGCGASKQTSSSGSHDYASREVPGTPTTPSVGKLAECNRFSFAVSGENLSVSLATFYDQGRLREDMTQMVFNREPEELYQDNTRYIQIFRWAEEVAGSRISDSTPVEMYFLDKTTGSVLNPDEPVDKISRSTMRKFIVDHPIIRASNFFENVTIILVGMDLRWDAIEVGIYDSETEESIGLGNGLVPAFSADPNKYAANHGSLSLQALHPNNDRRTSGYSEDQYLAYTDEFCRDFF